MGNTYGIDSLTADVARAVHTYRDERERVEAIKPHLAYWMERQGRALA